MALYFQSLVIPSKIAEIHIFFNKKEVKYLVFHGLAHQLLGTEAVLCNSSPFCFSAAEAAGGNE